MTRQPDKRNLKMNSIKLKLSALLIALLVLPSCGGGGSGSVNPDPPPEIPPEVVVQPPTKFYGAYRYGTIGSRNCSDGWAVGVATGYSSSSTAASAAKNECRRGGGGGCGDELIFGSAYIYECLAVSFGTKVGSCSILFRHGATLTAARSAALSACQSEFSTCEIEVSECSTSGPADSFYRIIRTGDTGGSNTGGGNTGSGNTGGSNTGGGSSGGGNTGGGNTSSNQAPVVRGGFSDATVQQGKETTYSNVSRSFSDPDDDRLTITATSSHPSFATARISGDTLYVRGVQAFTSGSGPVRITVTATDPDGRYASTSFDVRVTAAPRQWGYYAITGSSCTGRRRGWSLNNGYSDQASVSSYFLCRI